MADSSITEMPTSSMGPDTEWSTREKLAIASYVQRSGEQHWSGVGRILKPVGEPGRPADWFSPKYCAQQYTALLEQLDAPKRKRSSERSDSSENIQPGASPEDIMVSRLTKERIDELKKQLRYERTEYRKLRREIELIESGVLDDQLDVLLNKIENEGKDDQMKGEQAENETENVKVVDKTEKQTFTEDPKMEKLQFEENSTPIEASMDDKSSILAEPEEIKLTEIVNAEKTNKESMEITPDITDGEQSIKSAENTGNNGKFVPDLSSETDILDTHGQAPSEDKHSKVSEATNELKVSSEKIDSVQKDLSEETESTKGVEPAIDAPSETTLSEKDVVVTGSTKPIDNSEFKILANDDAAGSEEADSTYNLSIDDGTHQSNSLPGTPATQGSLVFDSFPSSPALSHSSDMDPDATANWKAWRKSIMILWKQVASHRYASLFLQPVTNDIAPNYSMTVYRSMDLATIKKNIESGAIRTTSEFRRDVMLMFQNAIMYNSCEHDVYKMTMEMQKDVIDQIAQFLATQMMVETAQPLVNKSLRRSTMRRSALSEKVGETRSRRSTTLETEAKPTR